MWSNYRVEFQQDPFDSEEFVERLAWRSTNNQPENAPFDPVVLYDIFEQSIENLKTYYDELQTKCNVIEASCREEEKKYAQFTSQLLQKNKDAFETFQQLEERIDYVATKVVHLGDQLDSVNTPRARAVEAQKLMKHFAEFLTPGPLTSSFLSDPSKLNESADIIQKLYLIVQDLPQGKFDKPRQKIQSKYDEIEQILIEEFVRAQRADDREKMKEMATILSNFKSYNECINAFIEQSQMGAFIKPDIYSDIVPLCQRSNVIIQEVFTNPEQVMAKFVLNIFQGKLQWYIESQLGGLDSERYLKVLYDLYSKTLALCTQLSDFNMGNDSTYLNKLVKNIFGKRLSTYISTEKSCLKQKCCNILQQYYDSIGHQKKNVQAGFSYELRRELQAKLGNVENYGGETFLSEEVAINLLQESKLALQRCKILSEPAELPVNALELFTILLNHLCQEHLDYALELGLNSIPEPRANPEIHFFDVVRQCNAIFHLLEKKIADSVIPLVMSTSKHGECLQKKKAYVELMESKIHNGLDKSLNCLIGWVKTVLQSEQKKTDFKPEGEDVSMFFTTACSKVTKFLTPYLDKIYESLDGQNVEAVLTELGLKFHRVVLEHLQQFQYNSFGAMVVICDVNEYRKFVQKFKVPLLDNLFDTLHALCNLLVVDPKNLKQVSSGEQLADLDKSVIQAFIQLRADFKTAKLQNLFK
ncbi:EXOC5 [Cordylochernes scorpioides]|uniref:Exocyst complex component 5 n=1 Tax=Cordylochernes scorpioides TaxID=51811 RepID=A0ABY6KEJ7_9ARAC|nr:EXOC5 [Cordylochernes scorpioides]